MTHITSCLLIFLSCSFEACFLKFQSVPALLSLANTLLCQQIPIFFKRLPPLWRFCVLLHGGFPRNRSRTNLRPVRVLSFCPRYQFVTARQVGLMTCKTVCRQNDQTWPIYFSREYLRTLKKNVGSGDVEEGVQIVNCAVVNDKPKQVWHDSALFRTLSQSLLPRKFSSTSTTILEMATTMKSESECDALSATENKWCAMYA